MLIVVSPLSLEVFKFAIPSYLFAYPLFISKGFMFFVEIISPYLAKFSFVIGIGSIIIIGIVDLLIGILLLMKLNEAPTLLKIFAIMSVMQGVVGMTVFFAGILIFIIPVTFIVLAMFFLRKPESIEIV